MAMVGRVPMPRVFIIDDPSPLKDVGRIEQHLNCKADVNMQSYFRCWLILLEVSRSFPMGELLLLF